MSYCRFSSDDWKSDVYVYESAEGFVTQVASHRRVMDEALPPRVPIDEFQAFIRRDIKVHQMLKTATLTPIDLPEAGADFLHDTASECADNLERLSRSGFHVPQGAIDCLRE